MYCEINEKAAKQAHEANSFRAFEEGRATASYRSMVDKAKDLADRCKNATDPMYHDKIDRLLDTYARKLAANINKGFEIDSRVPSIMIAGGSNFPVAKKEKQNAARDKNMEEYNQIQELLEKMRSVGSGGISADDPNAVEKLKEKLTRLEEKHDLGKKMNVYWRKHGTMTGCPGVSEETAEKINKDMKNAYSWIQNNGPYTTTNTNAEIKRLKKRIEELAKRDEVESMSFTFDGGKVVHNSDINRLQIFFDEKPSEELRTKLKKNGFKWAPSQNAWQRQFTSNAIRGLRELGLGPLTKVGENEER